MRILIVILCWLCWTCLLSGALALATPPAEGPQKPAEGGVTEITLDHIDPATGMLYFKAPEGTTAPKPIQLELHDLSVIGTLRSAPAASPKDPAGLPFFILSGRPCENCIQDKAIYVLRPQPGKLSTFVYPGKIFEPKSRSLVLESRAFFGKCLAGHGDVLIVFQKERIDRRSRLASSVMLAEPGPDHLDERLIEARLPSLDRTLHAVRAKSCHEIDGRNRVMVSRPSMLLPSHKGHPEVDDDSADDNDDSGKDDATGAPGGKATESPSP